MSLYFYDFKDIFMIFCVNFVHNYNNTVFPYLVYYNIYKYSMREIKEDG